MSDATSESLVGTVWRKRGPCGWLRVVEEHFMRGDGSLGVSVQFRSEHGIWMKRRWFFACSSRSEFVARQIHAFRYREDQP